MKRVGDEEKLFLKMSKNGDRVKATRGFVREILEEIAENLTELRDQRLLDHLREVGRVFRALRQDDCMESGTGLKTNPGSRGRDFANPRRAVRVESSCHIL